VNARRADGLAALHRAAALGHKYIVSVLIESGADMNVKIIEHGVTPLHAAVGQGHIEVTKMMIEKGLTPIFAPLNHLCIP
jgi:ankyrin repeat protein